VNYSYPWTVPVALPLLVDMAVSEPVKMAVAA
jgi:hypothetical protein